MRYLVGFVFVLALGVMGCGETEGAGGFPCTEQGIRDAIAEGGGPHTFACDGPQTVVTKAEIVIDNDVILDGEGNLTLDGNGGHRIISIPYISWDQTPSVELHGLRLIGGQSFSGSAIENEGTLLLENCVVSGNTSDHPGWGAVANMTGARLTIRNSSVSNNVANGVAADSLSETVIAHSKIEGNTGSGVHNGSGIVSIENSLVSRNGDGGLYNGFLMTVRSSTVSQNHGEVGGALGNAGYTPEYAVQAKSPYGAEAVVLNSTISGNSAAQGGAIFNSGEWGKVHVSHSTFAHNSTSDGADIESVGGSWVSFTNSIIHGSCGYESLSGSTSNAGNIESPGDTCGLDQLTDQTEKTAEELNLEPLQDNGGPTPTHALGQGSLAIDKIPVKDCVAAKCVDPGDWTCVVETKPLTTDQRGEPRPETGGTMCDVGAFEVQP